MGWYRSLFNVSEVHGVPNFRNLPTLLKETGNIRQCIHHLLSDATTNANLLGAKLCGIHNLGELCLLTFWCTTKYMAVLCGCVWKSMVWVSAKMSMILSWKTMINRFQTIYRNVGSPRNFQTISFQRIQHRMSRCWIQRKSSAFHRSVRSYSPDFEPWDASRAAAKISGPREAEIPR